MRQTIDATIAAGLAPLLLDHGFRKSGRDFRRDDGESVAHANVQASRSNAGDSGRFTVNLGRYFPAVAAIQGAVAAGRWPKEYECTLRQRLGCLVDGEDRWWRVHAGADNAAVAAEVRALMEAVGLPWLARTATLTGLRAEPLPRLTKASAALAAGDTVEALHLIRGECPPGCDMPAHVSAWLARNGLALS